jgi:catechol 2,3-dioxygenase-like lactoylglutathione lyase family enzyme
VHELLALHIADPAELWHDLGFAVQDGACHVDGICHQLGAPGRGVVAWSLRGTNGLSELATEPAPTQPKTGATHRNGVTALDHVVVTTPDLARTVAAFESAGLALRRTRDTGSEAQPITQAFFKLGPVVIEVVGPPSPSGSEPATFWGLTFTVADLDATAAFLGPQLRPIKEAVQQGRRIATLHRDAGSSVPMAFMSRR